MTHYAVTGTICISWLLAIVVSFHTLFVPMDIEVPKYGICFLTTSNFLKVILIYSIPIFWSFNYNNNQHIPGNEDLPGMQTDVWRHQVIRGYHTIWGLKAEATYYQETNGSHTHPTGYFAGKFIDQFSIHSNHPLGSFLYPIIYGIHIDPWANNELLHQTQTGNCCGYSSGLRTTYY